MERIVGREKEIAQLTEFAHSDRSEFVAVYGRFYPNVQQWREQEW